MPAIPDHDWEHSVYGKHEEEIAKNLPEPLGKRIILTHYFDASLMHDILSGKAVTSMCVHSTTRLLLIGIVSSNLHLNQPRMV